MPRKKTTADEIYNARRRLKREAARAEKKGDIERARQLRNIAAQTYINRGNNQNFERAAQAAVAGLKKENKQSTSNLIKNLRSIATQTISGAAKKFKQIKKNYLNKDNERFKKQLYMASSGYESTLDSKKLSGRSKTRIFWMSTQRIWEGLPPEQRINAILQAFNTDSLRKAFNKVLDLNKEAVKNASQAEKEVRDTLKDMGDERPDEGLNIGSPPEFMALIKDAYSAINLME